MLGVFALELAYLHLFHVRKMFKETDEKSFEGNYSQKQISKGLKLIL